MTKLQPINELIAQLNMPAQDLAQLSFCDGHRDNSIKAWVRGLPLTQTQFVSGLLYQALPDISRLQTNTTNRLHLLEALRSPTLQTIEGLAQGFLNQPLILPDSAVKTATVAQALQKHLINGYLVLVRDLCKQNSHDKETLSLAIHRAITSISLLLMRYYQLYVPISGQLWTELHCLFQIALHYGIIDSHVGDNFSRNRHCTSIKLTYIRTLLLACARPNQLRQDEILSSFTALDELSSLAQLHDPVEGNHNNLFAVALSSNRPPLYRSRFTDSESDLILELNTAQLCKKLTDVNTAGVADGTDGAGLRNELNLTSSLTLHLVQSWNLLAQRHFDRTQANGTLDVTVGLTNIHFHLANKIGFTHFLSQSKSQQTIDNIGSIFQKRGAQLKDKTSIEKPLNIDPWADAFDVVTPSMNPIFSGSIEYKVPTKDDGKDDEPDSNPIYHVPLIDSSPGGYCIEWRDEIPNQVKAGELLGLRDPVRNRWSLGVVRWANQTKGATQLGIQILAPQATPVGVAIIHKTGSTSEFLRALEIPALKAINQPASLITNAVSFREYSKARLYRRADDSSENINIQLTRRLFATGGFSQFTYRELASTKMKEPEPKDDFDSIWDS